MTINNNNDNNYPFFTAVSGTSPVTIKVFSLEEDKPASSRDYAAVLNPGNFRGQFSPRTLPGLVQWIDFSNRATVTTDVSGNITRAKDLSGNGTDVFQPSTANCPLYVTSSLMSDGSAMINNKSVVHFKQVASPNSPYLIFRRDGQRVLASTGCTVFLVWKPAVSTLITAFQGMWVNTANSSWNTGIGITGGASANIIYTWVDNYLSNLVSKTITGEPIGTPIIITLQYDKTSVKQFYSGTLVGVDAFTSNISNGTTTNSGTVGVYVNSNDPAGTFGSCTASLGEIIYYDRGLAASELVEVHRYLFQKWGTSGSFS